MNPISRNVFLADDDADDREMFGDALTELVSEGITLIEARNGKELMDLLEETVPPPPEVIFLDLNMPRKNGFECLAEIRETQKLKKIPVVIYSTSSDKAFIDRVYKQGADYYICKPASYPLLKLVISKALSINWKQHTGQPSRDQFILS